MKSITIKSRHAAGLHDIACTLWKLPRTDDATPVVCVHGLTRNGRDFDALARRLQSGAPVYCPDMPGRGASDPLPPTSYNFDQYQNDAMTIIARTGGTQVDWVGTSMGGILGMLLASYPNSPIKRLVLNDVGPLIPKSALEKIGGYVGKQVFYKDEAEAEAHFRQIYMGFGRLTDLDWKDMVRHGVRAVPGGFAPTYDPRIAEAIPAPDKDADLWAVFDKIRCPVLILRGEHSELLPQAVADEMVSRLQKADVPVRIETIAGAGHAPALVNDETILPIAQFLELENPGLRAAKNKILSSEELAFFSFKGP